MLGPASIGFHAKQPCVHMCVQACGCLHVCLFGVCRCRRAPPPPIYPSPGGPRMLKPSTTTIPPELAISSQKNNCTADNEETEEASHCTTKSCRLLRLFVPRPSLVTAFCNVSASSSSTSSSSALFISPSPALLNGMDSLIACFAEQIYLCSFFLS